MAPPILSPGSRKSPRLTSLEAYRFPARGTSLPPNHTNERNNKIGSRPVPLRDVGRHESEVPVPTSMRLSARPPATAPLACGGGSGPAPAPMHTSKGRSPSLSDLSESDGNSSASDSDDEADGEHAPPSEPAHSASSATTAAPKSPRVIKKAKPASRGVKAPRKRDRRGNRPDGQPPRPMNSWLQYRSQRISEMREEYGHLAQFGAQSELSRRIAEDWHALSAKEKMPFERMAEDARQEHFRKYPGYRFQPRRGVKAQKAAAKKSGSAKKKPAQTAAATSKPAPRATDSSTALSEAVKKPTTRPRAATAPSKTKPDADAPTRSPRHGAFPAMPRQGSPASDRHALQQHAPQLFVARSPSPPAMPEPQFARPHFECSPMSIDEYAQGLAFGDAAGRMYAVADDHHAGLPIAGGFQDGYVEAGRAGFYDVGPSGSVYGGLAAYKFPAHRTLDVAMSESTPGQIALDSPLSTVEAPGDGSQQAEGSEIGRPLLDEPPSSDMLGPRRLDIPLTTHHRRPSFVRVLPAGPPGSVPELSEHLDVMEPAESWRDRRQSHSLLAIWQGLPQLGMIPEAMPTDQEEGHATEAAWQQYINVPDEQPPQAMPSAIDAQMQSDDALLASLGIDLPPSTFRNADIFDDRASAFAEGRSWLDAQSAMPWTRDDVVRGREAWFSRSGHIPTVPLLVQPHWIPAADGLR